MNYIKLTQENIKKTIRRIILINIIFFLIVFLVNIFVDFEIIYKKIPFLEEIEYQNALILTIFIFELISIILVSWRLMTSKKSEDSLSIDKIITKGENDFIEFKSSLRWDLNTNQINKDLEKAVLKTIAGFLNATGGTLIIGIDDKKKIVGIEKDILTLKKRDADGFIIHLVNLVNGHIGKEFSPLLSVNVEKHNGFNFCKIDVTPSKKPVYLNLDGKEEFWVRIASTTQPMQIKEAHNYIDSHWK